MSFADNIKRLRENKGLQQKQVAIEIGLGISHYNKIENGQWIDRSKLTPQFG